MRANDGSAGFACNRSRICSKAARVIVVPPACRPYPCKPSPGCWPPTAFCRLTFGVSFEAGSCGSRRLAPGPRDCDPSGYLQSRNSHFPCSPNVVRYLRWLRHPERRQSRDYRCRRCGASRQVTSRFVHHRAGRRFCASFWQLRRSRRRTNPSALRGNHGGGDQPCRRLALAQRAIEGRK